MGLFKKETLQVIECRLADETIAYRYPEENFNTSSVLFVQPGQEAILIKEGTVCDVFKDGRYPLSTENIPFLRKLLNLPFGGKSQFRCYIYFVNKEKEITVRWGTADPINVVDPRTGLLVRMGGRGSYSVKVDNSVKLLTKMIGQRDGLSVKEISTFLFNKTIELITSNISNALQYKGISFTQISSHYRELSETVYEQIRNDRLFEEYGLALRTFSILAINISDEDFKKIQETENQFINTRREAAAEADAMRMKGFAEGDVMRNQGIYFDKKRTYDVMEAAAKNEGSGNLMNSTMGLGMGLGVGAGFGNMMGMMSNNMNQGVNQQPVNQNSNGVACPNCNTINDPNAKFCSGCGKELTRQTVACPACGSPNPAGAKFCSNCGKQLVQVKVRCPSCNADNEPGCKFCSNCGAKLG